MRYGKTTILMSGIIFLTQLWVCTVTDSSADAIHHPLAQSSEHTDPYLICEKGERQSPINIPSSAPTKMIHELTFQYQPTDIHIIHDGHSLRALNKNDSRVLVDGQVYRLLQFHFHDPSEHHIDGVSFPMEMHLVHQNSEGHILVIGVLFQEGKENSEIARAGAWIKKQLGHYLVYHGEEVSGHYKIDIMKLLPDNLSNFFTYSGSLTTPPCSEGVKWVVIRDPTEIASEQVDRFVSTYGPTARPIQPLHGRDILGQ